MATPDESCAPQTTFKLKVAELKPLQRNSSYDILPPDFAELRLVLLGSIWSQRSSVGNFLLGKTEFIKNLTKCVKVRRTIKDKILTVVNPPDLDQSNYTEDILTEFIGDIEQSSAPGPHVFLLLLQPEDFTEQQKNILESVLESFSEEAFQHSLVLICSPREQRPGFMEKYMNEPQIRDIIVRCRYRYVFNENLQYEELLTRVGQIVKENTGKHICKELKQDEVQGLRMTFALKAKSSLNLVLCGRTKDEKSSLAESMLGSAASPTASSPEQCVKHQGEVCGRWVSLVELPPLSGKPQEEVVQQCLSCISLCDPEGVHAFILVLPLGPLTDEDKKERDMIQNIFSSRVRDFTVVLFTVNSDSTSAMNLSKKTSVNIAELCESCEGGSLCLNIKDKQQILEVIKTVENLTEKGNIAFTKDMFLEAQIEKVFKQKSAGTPEILSGPLGLRLLLIGKSGSGKSATANTILGMKCFKPKASVKANTSCEMECSIVNERTISIVNTPPLFDERFNIEELSKCFSLLNPGPNAFLLVLPIGNISKDDRNSLEVIKKMFGKKVVEFLMVVFSQGDQLGNQPFEKYLGECDDFVRDLVEECQGRCHVLNNKDAKNQMQVSKLLYKIDKMVQTNCGFTKEMFELERKETNVKLLHEKVVKDLKNQIGEGNKKLELKERQIREKDECLSQERQERKKELEEEGKKRRRQEDMARQEWRRKLEESERRACSEVEERRRAEKHLEQLRKEMDRRQRDWDRERKEILESRCQELKQNLDVQSERFRLLQEEYFHKRKKWTYILFVSLLCSLFLGYYLFLKWVE